MDLNLIRVFDALLEERNVNRAGRRLGLTQSAVSHALNRLRHHLQDQLFVRTRSGMVPTARALEVSGQLRDALRQVERVFGVETFDPATARRRFVLAANDMLTATVGAGLLRVLSHTAPGIDLAIRPSTRIDLAEQIDIGQIDLALGVFSDVPARFRAEVVATTHDVAALRSGHPAAGNLTTDAMSAYPLAVVSMGGPEVGAVGGYILERGLARQSDGFDRDALVSAFGAVKKAPRLRVVTPHSLAAPLLIAETDTIAIVPDLLSDLFKNSGLIIRPLPYESATTVIRLIWAERLTGDPGHSWFRALVAKVASK